MSFVFMFLFPIVTTNKAQVKNKRINYFDMYVSGFTDQIYCRKCTTFGPLALHLFLKSGHSKNAFGLLYGSQLASFFVQCNTQEEFVLCSSFAACTLHRTRQRSLGRTDWLNRSLYKSLRLIPPTLLFGNKRNLKATVCIKHVTLFPMEFSVSRQCSHGGNVTWRILIDQSSMRTCTKAGKYENFTKLQSV